MTNTMNLNANNNTVNQIASAIYADLKASNAKVGTMDEMYEAVKKYVSISKEQFAERYNNMKAKHELEETELDMVVGGSLSEFLSSGWGTLAIIAASVLVCGAIGAGGLLLATALTEGFAVAGTAAAATGALATVGQTALTGAVVGGIVGLSVGGCLSVSFDNNLNG